MTIRRIGVRAQRLEELLATDLEPSDRNDLD
jgi:hypothetical protein